MGILKDMGWQGYSNHLWLEARKRCIPITGTFELTPLCNFSCRMCYVHLTPERMRERGKLHSADEWLQLAQEAMDAGTYHITLTGGEVLTRPDFAQIYQGMIEMGLTVSVLSNASLIAPQTVELFQTYRPTRLRFTLYGASNETYERLCGVPDGFDRVMRGLSLLKAAGILFSLAFTLTKENAEDLNPVLDIAKTLGVNIAIANGLFPAVRGATSEAASLRVDPDKVPTPQHEVDNDKPDPLASLLCDEQTEMKFRKALGTGPFATCKSYRTSFFIDWDGTMETCSYMDMGAAHPFEEGFRTAWNKLHATLSALELPAECQSCKARPWCNACPGLRSAEIGSPVAIPRAWCERAYAKLTRGTFDLKGGESQ